MLNKTITFLRKNAKDHRDLVAHEIGGDTLRGLSNTPHASTGIAHYQVIELSGQRFSISLFYAAEILPNARGEPRVLV